jgi:hypothetical protein
MKNLIIILLISLFFRLLYLNVIPVSLAHDEIDNIIQAQAVRHTGSDISGVWHPLSFLPTPTLMGELAPLINVPMLSILPQSIFSSRATSAILSSFYPLLLVIFLVKLGVSKKVAYTAAGLIAVSPWHIIFSRTALEQPVSLFFYTSSWIFLIDLFKSKKIDYAFGLRAIFFILFYTFGFFTYHGFKFSLPILTGVLAFYFAWFNTVKYKWPKLITTLLFIGVLFIHVLINQSHYLSRSVELIFQDTNKYASSIDLERRVSLAPDSLKRVFSNKYVSLAQAIGDKYLYAISPDLLFEHGENNGMFSLWTIGYFYLFSLPLILIGLMSMLRTRSKEQILLLVLLILSPTASIIHTNNSYAFRSAIYFVLLNVILAYGCVEIYGYVSHSLAKDKTYIFGIFTLIALSSIAHFSYLYFFVSPVSNSGSFFFGDQLLSKYLNLARGHKVLVIDAQPRYVYSNLLLSRPVVSRNDILSFNHQYSGDESDTYTSNDLTIMRDCPESIEKFDIVIIGRLGLEDTTRCDVVRQRLLLSTTNNSGLVAPKNNGIERVIIGDKLCDGIHLSSFVHPISISDFKLNQLSREEFCTTWIVKQ